jgi:hypothetical protein
VFETLTGDVQGPLEVKGAVTIDGTLHGGAVVTGRLQLNGTCNGPIEIRLDGQAEVNAVVHGDVHARGGKLRFRGVLNGRQLNADGSFSALEGKGKFSIPADAPLLRPNENGNWTPAD